MALWAFLFLSPLTFWRGTGIKFMQYLMYCMQPAMLMVVFYLNYLYLAPKFFVAGKHRYDLLINVVMITVFGISLHYWIEFANDLFGVHPRFKDTISDVTNILRNCLDFCIFAGGSTALALARKWVTAEQKLRESEAAKTEAELKNLRSQINPHFLRRQSTRPRRRKRSNSSRNCCVTCSMTIRNRLWRCRMRSSSWRTMSV